MTGSTKTTIRPRAYRTFTVGFGLGNVKIAIGSIYDDPRPSGRYCCPEHGEPVSERWYCAAGNHIIDRGESYGDGRFAPCTGYPWDDEGGQRFVVPSDSDLDGIRFSADKEMEIEAIVPVASIDPAFYETPYGLWPCEGAHNQRVFAILSEYLKRDDRAAVGKISINNKPKMLVFRWSEHFGIMISHVCRFDEGFRLGLIENIKGVAEEYKPSTKDLSAARPILAALDGDFDTRSVKDEHSTLLKQLIESLANATKPKNKTRRRSKVR